MWPGILILSYIILILTYLMTDRSSASFIKIQKLQLNVESNSITISDFIENVGIDLGIIIGSIILWRILWYKAGRLSIWDLKRGEDVKIGSESSIIRCLKNLHKILKNVASLNNYVIHKCGFEAFTYLFFLRRFYHLMAILTLTDLCIWIPYQFYFNDVDDFSLVSM